MRKLLSIKNFITGRFLKITAAFLLSPGFLVAATLRVASVQMPIEGDVAKNLEYIRKSVVEAKKNNARVVVFPETALSGFFEEDIKRVDLDKLKAAQEEIAHLAQANGIYIVYGTATPSPYERPYNSALVIDPRGK